MGYNVIAVGAFDDNNTGSNLSDDSMATWSSYIDPSSTYMDREKPELVAPGVNIETTFDAWPWITNPPGVSGTSFATPHVSGAANVLMNRDATLTTWPEAVKSILMTTAYHNLEGSSRLSEYDGAGGISLGSAYYLTANTNNWHVYTLTPSNFNPSFGPIHFYAYKGQRVRAAISWAVDPNYSGYPDRPGVDLDLSVYTPSCSGTCYAKAYSTSFDNNYEIVDFVASVSGWWRVYISKRTFYDANTTLGIAWRNTNY